ncbi:apolipophorin-III-like protein [Xylocopa sonorina]|uniref:apolipophorin-III-like protein n=1 Tax=Xylocopa sonorina TaxID=1818115 RepID=UPI00403AD171
MENSRKMKNILVVIFAVVLVSEAKVAPSTGTANSGSSDIQLTELINQAQTNINNLAKQIQEQLNIPDQQTIVNTVKEESNKFATNMQDFMKNITAQVKDRSPELESMWNSVKGNLTKVFDDMIAGIPNAQQQVADLEAKFQQGVQTVLNESDTAAKSLSQHSGKIQEDLAKFTKQAVDIAVQATQNLNNQLQQAAAAAQKS